MIQLNLLPDLKKDFIKAQKNKGLVISSSILATLGALGLSALVFVYVNFAQQIQIDLMTQDVQTKAKELADIKDVDKYLTIQNQLSSLESLHNSKGVYSRLFDFFNVLNPSAPNNVTLSGAQLVTDDTSIVFNGTTASFESLNVFVDTLKNTKVKYSSELEAEPAEELMFSQVLVQSSGLSQGDSKQVVAFTVRAVYTEPVFSAINLNVSAEVPAIVTTPSATEAPIPQEAKTQQPLFDSEEAQ